MGSATNEPANAFVTGPFAVTPSDWRVSVMCVGPRAPVQVQMDEGAVMQVIVEQQAASNKEKQLSDIRTK